MTSQESIIEKPLIKFWAPEEMKTSKPSQILSDSSSKQSLHEARKQDQTTQNQKDHQSQLSNILRKRVRIQQFQRSDQKMPCFQDYYQADINNLVESNGELQDELTTNRGQLMEFHRKNQALKAEVREALEQLEEATAQAEVYFNDKTALQKLIKELRQENQTLKAGLFSNTKQISQLQSKVKEFTNEIQQSKAVNTADKQIQDLKKIIVEKETLIKSHENMIYSQRLQLTARQRNRNLLQNQIFGLKGQLEKNANYKQRLMDTENRLNLSQQDTRKSRARIQSLEQNLRATERQNRSLDVRVAELMSELQTAIKDLLKGNSELKNRDKKIDEYKDIIENMKLESKGNLRQIEKFKASVQDHKSMMKGGQNNESKFKKQLEQISKKYWESDFKINEQAQKLDLLERKNAVLKKRNDKFAKEIQDKNEQIEDLKKHMSSAKQSECHPEIKRKESETLQSQIELAGETVRKQEQKISQLQNNQQVLKYILLEKDEIIDRMTAQILQLRERVQEEDFEDLIQEHH